MKIPLEKKSINTVRNLGYRISYGEWCNLILNINRIDCENDVVRIHVKDNILSFKYEDYTCFDWGLFNTLDETSSYSKLINRHHASIRWNRLNGQSEVVVITAIHTKSNKVYNILVKDLLCDDIYTEKCVEKCKVISEHCHGIIRLHKMIIFETILNIIQHNYRRHEEMDIASIDVILSGIEGRA